MALHAATKKVRLGQRLRLAPSAAGLIRPRGSIAASARGTLSSERMELPAECPATRLRFDHADARHLPVCEAHGGHCGIVTAQA